MHQVVKLTCPAGLAGAVAGAGGGLCQVSIMGPMTYLVTGNPPLRRHLLPPCAKPYLLCEHIMEDDA